MEDIKIKIEKEVLVNDDDCETIIADGLYACHYWCDMLRAYKDGKEIDFKEELINEEGVEFRWHVNCEPEDKWHIMTRYGLASGIALAIKEGYRSVYVTMRGGCIVLDHDQIDAIGTDVIIQMALFGDVIYG